ncbi:MAG: AMP-binding protein, partial [Gammaproteobacteria bacterium]
MHELHPGRTDHPKVNLDSALDRDLALDSLSRVELGNRLEHEFDVTLDERLAFEAATPRDLLRALLKARAGRPLTLRATSTTNAPAADIALPSEAATLGDMLAWHVTHHATRPHIQFFDDYSDGAVLTYGELWHGALAVAGALLARGLEPGERVALMLPTGREYFLTFYGTLLAGGVPVPIYPPVRRQQLEDHLRRQGRILASCRAALLVTTSDALALAHLLTATVDSLRHVLDAAALTRHTPLDAPIARRAQDLAFLQYTSGSTGDPKGVVLSHANLLANVRADGAGMGATPADVFVSWLPLYHDMGLIGAWLGSLYHGVRLVVMPPLSFMSRPERWLWAIHRYGGTLSAAPNFAFELCLKRIRDSDLDGLDLSRWRIAANGAEAISARTLEAFCARYARYGFRREAMFPVYGLAECAVGLAFTPLGRGPRIDDIERDTLASTGRAVPAAAALPEQRRQRVVSCGVPLPRHEIRVVDGADRELPERHEGRLQFRGPSATSGYFARPEATASLLRGGWLETGDRAYIAGGELHVTGRVKDVIIRAGRNIYPTELEDAVGELDGVRKGHVAVFGSADDDSGTERVIVMAETRRQGDAARATLTSAINELATDLIAGPPDQVLLVRPNTVL